MAKLAKAEVVVAFSSQDRQLLRDIRDALRALDGEPEDSSQAAGAVQRIVESAKRGATPAFRFGNGPSDEWDYKLLDDHIVADTKGYTWNGQGWVPKA